MSETDENIVKCGTHGPAVAAVVCQHLVKGNDRVLGFIENSSEPDDLQGWCGDCEAFYLQENDMTEEFKEYSGISIVCEFCYASIKEKHTALNIT